MREAAAAASFLHLGELSGIRGLTFGQDAIVPCCWSSPTADTGSKHDRVSRRYRERAFGCARQDEIGRASSLFRAASPSAGRAEEVGVPRLPARGRTPAKQRAVFRPERCPG